MDLPATHPLATDNFGSLLGFSLAFMPLEDRPLDQWFIAFSGPFTARLFFVWKNFPR